MINARILFVEDDAETAASVCAWMRRKGAQPTYASGPATADAELARAEFDLLLSDIHMDGNENLAWIERVARRVPALQIVLMTGAPRLNDTIKAANLHVGAFVVKPPNFDELETILTTLLATAEVRRRAKACIEDLRETLTHPAGVDEARVTSRLRELNEMWPVLENDSHAHSVTAAADLRTVLLDAVQVIERTRDSFRSRELGQLRQRLLRALAD